MSATETTHESVKKIVFDWNVDDVVIDANNDKDKNGILDIYDLPNKASIDIH